MRRGVIEPDGRTDGRTAVAAAALQTIRAQDVAWLPAAAAAAAASVPHHCSLAASAVNAAGLEQQL